MLQQQQQQGDLESLDSNSELGIAEGTDNSGSINGDDIDSEHLDPRVQVELEKLNEATDAINKLEKQLDEAKTAGRQAFHHMTHNLQQLSEKLGKCIQKARPYYEARVDLKKTQTELQHAALLYEKANATLKASKEIVRLTEEGLTRQGGKLDETWQEMLNYATRKVSQCESDLRQRQRDHWHASKEYAEAENRVKTLEKKFKSSINKSKPYYELRAQMNHFVEREKVKVYQLEQSISRAKITYSDALASLEGISEQIHLQRRLRDEMILQPRDSGCGTISDSHSYTDSLDLASMADGPLDIDVVTDSSQPISDPSERHQHMLDALHDILQKPKLHSETSTIMSEDSIYPPGNLRRSHADSLRSLPPTGYHTPRSLCSTSVVDQSLKNAQSFPLLNHLEEELNKLQVDGDKKSVVASAGLKRPLQTVDSIDSAMDSGSDTELNALDDDLLDDLHLERR